MNTEHDIAHPRPAPLATLCPLCPYHCCVVMMWIYSRLHLSPTLVSHTLSFLFFPQRHLHVSWETKEGLLGLYCAGSKQRYAVEGAIRRFLQRETEKAEGSDVWVTGDDDEEEGGGVGGPGGGRSGSNAASDNLVRR